jgi:hypothetical protein
MGLSMGYTQRSSNSTGTVAEWFVRKDLKARAFMVCSVSYIRCVLSENERLLGMDAVTKQAEKDPKILSASIVPFGPRLWTMKRWAGCWNKTHDGAVVRRLLETMGSAGALRLKCTRGPKSDEDLYANQVWDGLRQCSGRPDSADDADTHFPARLDAEPDMDTYGIDTLMAWNGGSDYGCYGKEQRIRFRTGFLTELAERGAVVLRPTQQFVDDMTGQVARWVSDQLAQRFSDRIQASRRYMKGLMTDVKRDIARLKAYRAYARKMAPEETRSRRTMLAETGFEI